MLAGLILAAGQGSRFGSDKRQALLPSGETLMGAALAQFADACDKLYVVIPTDDAFGQRLCSEHGAQIVLNPDAQQGMGRSLAYGIQAILNDADAAQIAGVIVGLADMPKVTTSLVQQIGHALLNSGQDRTTRQAVVPIYQGQMGHPRGIPSHLLAALTTLSGDQGAKAVINWSQAYPLIVDHAGVLQDIDTPQDLSRLYV
jgi:molybdenum cofactor cytidylyltransferase